ncbi:MAG: class I SAM-dependent methyltransferase, partial [Elusimicrobiota bacterium]
MERFEIINRFIKKYKYKRYLEIGVDEGLAFKKIKIKHKAGVDPSVDTDYRMTSDEFFAQSSENYDIIFIDGLHHSSQADKDIQNA